MPSISANFRSYWTVYGGFGALITSGFFWAAVALTALTGPWWASSSWWERVILIVPSMLGFTLGGYVMLLAVGSEKFMELLARSGGKQETALVGVSAAFVHFIMVEFLALLLTILFIATEEAYWVKQAVPLSAFLRLLRLLQGGSAMLVFYYSLTTGIAATLRIFSLTNLYVVMVRNTPPQPTEPPKDSHTPLPQTK